MNEPTQKMVEITIGWEDGRYWYARAEHGLQGDVTVQVPEFLVAVWEKLDAAQQIQHAQLANFYNASHDAAEEDKETKDRCEHGVEHERYCRECARGG